MENTKTYPEHAKLELFSKEQMQALNEFVEYMDGNIEATFVDTENKPKIQCSQDILYDFLKIDQKKIELERRNMLAQYQT